MDPVVPVGATAGRKPPSIGRRTLVLGVAAALLLVGCGVLALSLLTGTRERQSWVTHTLEAQIELTRLRGDVAAGGRAALIAAMLHQQEAHAEATHWSQQVGRTARQLSALVSDNPSQAARAIELETLVLAQQSLWRNVALAPDDAVVAATNDMQAGKRRIDDVVEQMRNAEATLLAKRSASFERSLLMVQAAVVATAALAALLLSIAVGQLLAEVRRRGAMQRELRRSEESLRALNAWLEREVDKRTAALRDAEAAQRLRNRAGRVLLAHVGTTDEAGALAAWRSELLDAGWLRALELRGTGRGVVGEAPGGIELHSRALERDGGALRYALSDAAGGDAAAWHERIGELASDLDGWLESRRQRALRAAAQRERDAQAAQIDVLFEQVPVALAFLDPQLRIVRVNRAMAALGGNDPHAVVGLHLQEVRRRRGTEQAVPWMRDVARGGPAVLNRPLTLPDSDDGRPPLQLLTSIVPLHVDDDALAGIAVIATDITELDEARARLARLASRLLQVEEDERRNLARELHDDLGQRLAALKMNLQLLGRALAGETLLADAIAIADGTIAQLRRRALDLRPPQLDELGLAAALRANAQQQARPLGIDVTVDVDFGDLEPRADAASHLYRIAQEALRNAIAHGAPSRVTIVVARDGDAVELAVEDDGRGVDAGGRADGMGLLNMRERAALLGGTFEFGRRVGGGCRVGCRWPAAALAAIPLRAA